MSSVAIASRGKQYASKILLQSGVMQESPNSSAFYGIAEESVSAPSSLIMSLKPNQMFQVYSKTAGASPTGYGTPQSGTAAPSVDPEFIGQQFIDTSNKNVYVATGTTAADWAQLN